MNVSTAFRLRAFFRPARWVVLALCLAPSARAATRTTGTLAAGTPFATPYYVCDSGQPGPIVMVASGVHGDEPAGPAAAEEIRRWSVARGRLIVVPRLNAPGLAGNRRTMPKVDEALEDLNRDFPRVGKNEPARGDTAVAIWRFVQQQKPAWLIDLHEAHTLHGTRLGSIGNSLLCCPSAEIGRAAAVLLEAVNATIPDARWKFQVARPPRDGSLARAAGEHLAVQSLIIETTRTDCPLATRIGNHRVLVRALLVHLGMEPGDGAGPQRARIAK